MNIIFTLCSNNYLSHAKALGDSVLKYNQDVLFVIGLVDKRSKDVDYSAFARFEIIQYDELGCTFFGDMILKYNVIEFNTAVKPFYFNFLFRKYGKGAAVYYIDPDICFYSDIQNLNSLLADSNIVITPHLCEPKLQVSAFETMVLNVGVYNLGFIGIRNTEESVRFLKWWEERLKEFCFIDHPRGLFVDQIWINLVPVLFDGVKVLKDPGYNMACWNFHERKLFTENGTYFVNSLESKLVFFHFSGFKPENLPYVGKIKTKEFALDSRPDLNEIFHGYAQALQENNYFQLKKVKPLLNFGDGKYTTKQRIGLSVKFRTNKYIKKIFGI